MSNTKSPTKSTGSSGENVFAHVPLEMQSPAYIPPGAIAKFDRQGPDAEKQPGETEYRLAVRAADKILKAERLKPEERERIYRLMEYAAPSRMFARTPEAKEVAELLDALVSPSGLLALLRQAEKAGRLRPKTADALDHAFSRMHNPAIFIAKQIQRELGLILLAPEFRQSRAGRPSAFMVALVADAVADELRVQSGQPRWDIVAAVVRAFVKPFRPAIASDPEHLRQLVVINKRRAKRRVQKKETSESWDDSKALLYQDAGLQRPAHAE